jgi:hypothetical protein
MFSFRFVAARFVAGAGVRRLGASDLPDIRNTTSKMASPTEAIVAAAIAPRISVAKKAVDKSRPDAVYAHVEIHR